MKMYNSIFSRFMRLALSIVFTVSLMVGVLPTVEATTSGIEPTISSDSKVADLSTADDWKKFFGDTTENAGGVWTDKSVFTDDALNVSLSDEDNFLVALSAIGSSESIVGVTAVPVDVMIILDMSSSMYNGSSKDASTVKKMVDAVNNMINQLEKNSDNRVGVVIYYGGDYIYPQSSADSSKVLLPLAKYNSLDKYLKVTYNGSKLKGIATTVNDNSYNVPNVAGTYVQQGILQAMNQLVASGNKLDSDTTRLPVFVFMSDGEPTAATEEFTNSNIGATMGNNQVANRQPNETDFVTQLTAAYAKKTVNDFYKENYANDDVEALFYTLSLGTSISLNVMDPSNNTTQTIDHYWKHLVDHKSVAFQTKYFKNSDQASTPTGVKYHTVKVTNGFPTSVDQRKYVDKTFTAANADGLADAFTNILTEISHKTKYYPTLVQGSAHLGGNVSFVDKIGEYMHVEDIKGIIINETLYTGEEMAKCFKEGEQGGSLGTYANPTKLGEDLVWAVEERLGISDANAARTLIGQAYEAGQLSYVDENNWSNYIGWYANDKFEYLGFWDEGKTITPSYAVYKVKSYGYLGANGDSNLMFATVQVRTNIQTGEQTVAFAVPAALLPTIHYEVDLKADGTFDKLVKTGATSPIRLVYEVALNEDIDELSLFANVDEDYLNDNYIDGKYYFYTNQWDRNNETGYDKVNTYSYFYPSRENSRFYYQEDTLIYSDTNGTVHTGTIDSDATYYRKAVIYTNSGSIEKYFPISSRILGTAKQRGSNWIIKKGTTILDTAEYVYDKTNNETSTLKIAVEPFLDVHGADNVEYNYDNSKHVFVIGATLGNNGRMAIDAETGIMISKVVDSKIATDEEFEFKIMTNVSDQYDTVHVAEDGTTVESKLSFDGTAAQSIKLKDGEKLYIVGIDKDVEFTVSETATADFELEKITLKNNTSSKTIENVNVLTGEKTATIVTEEDRIIDAYFVNTSNKDTTEVTISGKKVLENLKLVANMFEFILTDEQNNEYRVMNDSDGTFEFTLDYTVDDVGVHSYSLKEGCYINTDYYHIDYDESVYNIKVKVEVVNNALVANIIEMTKGTAEDVAALVFHNVRVYDPILSFFGTKTLTGRTLQADEFEFILYESNNEWDKLSEIEKVKNDANGTFEFDEITYDNEGVHYYIIKENTATPMDRVTYDENEYRVMVEVIEHNTEPYIEELLIVDADGNEVREITFNNVYDVQEEEKDDPMKTSARFIVEKELEGRELKASEFTFVLKDKDGEVLQTKRNTAKGTVSFAPISYNRNDIGTHYYTISEVAGNDEDITYDTTVYQIMVEVSKKGSKLVADIYVDGEEDNEIIFTNKYVDEDDEPEVPEDPEDPTDPTEPEEPTKPEHDVPNTADTTDYALWFMMMLLAMIASVMFYKLREE